MKKSDVESFRRDVIKDPTAKSTADECERILVKSRLLLGRTGLLGGGDDAFLRLPTNNKLMIVFGKLDCLMGRFLLKKEGKQTFKNGFEIARQFVANLKAAFPDVDTAAYDEFGQPGPAEEASRPLSTFDKPQFQLYEKSAGGELVDPIGLLRKKGLDVGSVVSCNDDQNIFEVVNAEGLGSTAIVHLKRVGDPPDSQEIKSVEWGKFLEAWNEAAVKDVLQPHPGWPDNRTVALEAAQELFHKGAILDAVSKVATRIEQTIDPKMKLRILQKPTRKVVVVEDTEVGALILGPDTTAIKLYDPSSKEDPPPLPEVFVDPPFERRRTFLGSAANDKNVTPYWCITPTEMMEKVNMEEIQAVVNVASCVEFAPLRRWGKASQLTNMPEGMAEGEAVERIVRVPALRNSTRLQAGEELFVYRKKTEKRKKEPEEITITSLQKERKAHKKAEASA